ncbi:hypothetical protein [Terrisporobacter glycolicus]|uniref:hypothetical protein n=1 Tax=Terrisporobacter glycolicus TaxID=36841 RepID=UPI0003AACAB0|nr:hypothetical protein [Terrisporobacter glycolicus]
MLNIISDTYNSYTNFYDFAIEPSGNYDEYSNKNSSKIDEQIIIDFIGLQL